jgi:hypothetical protein
MAILVRDCLYSVSVPLLTTLQAVAVHINLDALSFNICNIYLRATLPIANADLVRLLSQLSTSFVLLGDFNVKHMVWGSDLNDDRGVLFHDLSSRLPLLMSHFSTPVRTPISFSHQGRLVPRT